MPHHKHSKPEPQLTNTSLKIKTQSKSTNVYKPKTTSGKKTLSINTQSQLTNTLFHFNIRLFSFFIIQNSSSKRQKHNQNLQICTNPKSTCCAKQNQSIPSSDQSKSNSTISFWGTWEPWQQVQRPFQASQQPA